MNIAILTQPLYNNYGGILQNYALQKVLKELGHNPVTIDWHNTLALKWYLRGLARSLIKHAPYRPFVRKRPSHIDSFIHDYIETTPSVIRYHRSQLRGVDAVVVGSDQVWRFEYNRSTLTDMFLGFARDYKGLRIAYAASFGLDDWDAPASLRRACSALSKSFDYVSVREESGVSLCNKELGVDAVQMPDPVLLLKASDYLDLCKEIPQCAQPFICAYVLDSNPVIDSKIQQIQERTGYPVRRFSIGAAATWTVQEWLAQFRDAGHVVTDSYHGALFSTIFGKEYSLVENEVRGRARFTQLREITDLNHEYNRGRSFLKEALSRGLVDTTKI